MVLIYIDVALSFHFWLVYHVCSLSRLSNHCQHMFFAVDISINLDGFNLASRALMRVFSPSLICFVDFTCTTNEALQSYTCTLPSVTNKVLDV